MIGYWVIFIGFMLFSMIVGGVLKQKFKRYAKVRIGQNLSGAEIAQRMLHESGIYDVKIVSVQGRLSDHYNPMNKTK